MNVSKELWNFSDVIYYDEPHLYYIGDKTLISGTTFIGLFKNKFDKVKTGNAYARKNKRTLEDVLAEWEYKGHIARTKGTLLHNYAENYWQNKVFPINYQQMDEEFGEGEMKKRLEPCINLFHIFYNDAKKSLRPVRMELVVADSELGIAGMVDCLFWNDKTKQYEIWDYKTNKEIALKSKYGNRFKAPINYLHDCEMNAYSLQLSLYKYIIEKNTKLKIGAMWLIHLHEDQEQYNLFQCDDRTMEIKLMLDYYETNKDKFSK